MSPRDAAEPPPADRPLSVSELAGRVKRVLEGGIGTVWVEGEVSNLRRPASGHCYFGLKDGSALINVVCFRGTLQRQAVLPADGMKLEIRGRLSAYEARSEYQIVAESLREAGLGVLMRRFLELKEKLRGEGLFDAARKRALPRLPTRIGIVTSSSGAALQDMLKILRRRARGLRIYLAPCAVQGEAAPAEIVAAIERLQIHGQAEVMIVGRGGGSIEDLWAFNDERVVRAIAASGIPVISAVGHETDTTLADYAADLRAPTPSAAAELVSAHHGELLEQLGQWRGRLQRATSRRLEQSRARLEACRRSWGLRSPRERLQAAMQRLDDAQQALGTALHRRTQRTTERVAMLHERLLRANPRLRLAALEQRLEQARRALEASGPRRWLPRLATAEALRLQWSQRLERAAQARLREASAELRQLQGRLAAVNHQSVLQRGYSIVRGERSGRLLTGPGQIREGQAIEIIGAQGTWRALTLHEGPDLFADSGPEDAT